MAYPFADPNPNLFADFTRQLEISYEIQSAYAGVRGRASGQNWEAMMHGLHHIRIIYGKDYKGKIFTDCLSLNYETALYAALYDFARVNCIALKPYEEDDVNIMLKFNDKFEGNVNKVCGRFQDYFVDDSDVVYIDMTILGDYLDEGLMLTSFFRCCKLLNVGALIIVISSVDVAGLDIECKMRLLFSEAFMMIRIFIYERI
jgi:hypothetical protein